MPSGGDGHGWVMEAVDLYELPLLRYARRLVDDIDLAADAVQHTFLKLCEESQERLDGRVAPWLFRVCRNRALDHLRHSGREQPLLDADAAGGAAAGSPDPPDNRSASEQLAAAFARQPKLCVVPLCHPQRFGNTCG
jgi:RNA polymerase sigma-70 factor (ECF subfamily)